MNKYKLGIATVLVVLAFIFFSKDASAKIVSEEGAKQGTENLATAPTEGTDEDLTYVPDKHNRIVAVGDLPDSHDPSLVLREGRIIRVEMLFRNIDSSMIASSDQCLFSVINNVYDESNQTLLVSVGTEFYGFYKIYEDQDKAKINITITKMRSANNNNIIVFLNPLRCINTKAQLSSVGARKMKRLNDEILRQREQLFLSPVMNAELVLGVESNDRTAHSGKVVFEENVSGDRTIFIGSGYEVDLQVRKDILFFCPSAENEGIMNTIY
jgi:hypothetical protein